MVKALYHGTFKFDGQTADTFIICVVDTNFGTLELNHSIEQVDESQHSNIRVGSVVSGVCVLSGDVAIYEYENGAIIDFEHDLMLLRYTFSGGDPQRLRRVLKDDSIYSSETNGEDYCGADSIIERIKYVQDNKKKQCFAYFATITESSEELEYPVGTRCIVLAYGAEDNFDSIVFIDVDGDGVIERIKISTDGRYKFTVERVDNE